MNKDELITYWEKRYTSVLKEDPGMGSESDYDMWYLKKDLIRQFLEDLKRMPKLIVTK